jgi:hypothetical protein
MMVMIMMMMMNTAGLVYDVLSAKFLYTENTTSVAQNCKVCFMTDDSN